MTRTISAQAKGAARKVTRSAASVGAALRDDAPGARALALFAGATLAPVALLGLGVAFGGVWAWLALLFITLIVAAMDRLVARAVPHVPQAQEFPAADWLSVLLACVHLALLPIVIWAVSADNDLSGGARLAIWLAAGLWLGQVSNSNAHELIHRSNRRLFRLGVAVYVSLLFGHHTSAHRFVHHRNVATSHDPNTAFSGETFYGFFPRAWWGAFIAGWQMENVLRERRSKPGIHPYLWYVGGSLAWIIGVAVLFGAAGLLVYLLLCLYAQIMLMLSDYVQHYGLERSRLPDGRLEPVGPHHSWNAPKWFSSAMMLNAPLHSDHHTHPARPYPALTMPEGAPRLPFSLPVMGAVALVPPLWFRMMDKRVSRLRRQARAAL